MKDKDKSCHCSHCESIQRGEEVQLQSFLALVIGEGEWSTRRLGHFIYAWERTAVPTWSEAGWAPKTVWTLWSRKKHLAVAGIRTPDLTARSLVTKPTKCGVCRIDKMLSSKEYWHTAYWFFFLIKFLPAYVLYSWSAHDRKLLTPSTDG
jgi:hypothetical protein